MILQVFPKTWDRRKISEIQLAIYTLCVGLLFAIWPGVLASPVYDGFREILSPSGWSSWMMSAVLLHAIALWVNGRNACLSSIIRVAACTSHLSIALTFAYLFAAEGAWWGTVTYCVLIVWPLLCALSYTAERLAGVCR